MNRFAVTMNHPIQSTLDEAASAFDDVAISFGFLEIILFQLPFPLFLLRIALFFQLECAGGTVLLEDLALLRGSTRLNSLVDFVQAEWLGDFRSAFQTEWRFVWVPLCKSFVDGKIGWIETRTRVNPDPPQVFHINPRERPLQQLVAREHQHRGKRL